MELVRSLARGSLPLLFLACHDSSGDSAPDVLDLGVAAGRYELEGDLLVVQTLENGHDLNGDGDSTDAFVETVDLARGARNRLPLAAVRGFELGAGFVSFTVNESAQGEDLNGDGDVSLDDVLHVHDTRDGSTLNLGLAVRTVGSLGVVSERILLLGQEGPLVAFVVSEADQGEDLDGDGELTHDLAHVWRADTETLVPLGLATWTRPVVEGGRVFFGERERDGLVDLNGDGDVVDDVLAFWDAATDTVHRLGRAVFVLEGEILHFGVEGELLAVAVSEEVQGTDENADGDLFDFLYEVHDLSSGTRRGMGLTVGELSVRGGLVGMLVPEFVSAPWNPDEDYNDDGDVEDQVVFFYDWLGDELTNTRMAAGPYWPPAQAGRRAAFTVRTGDVFDSDFAVHLFDARTGTVEPTGDAAGFGTVLDLDEERLACGAFRAWERVPVLIDLRTGMRTEIARSVEWLQMADERVHFTSHEQEEGRDLNGDGDTEDLIQRSYDARSGRLFESGLAVSPRGYGATDYLSASGSRVAVNVRESAQSRDFNGDGDLDDWSLHVVELP